MMIDVIWRSMIDQYLSKCELGLGLKSGLFGKEVFVRGRLAADFTVDRRQRARLHNRHNRNNNVIIIIITNLYSAFRSEDTNALEAAQEDSLRTVIAVSYVQPSPRTHNNFGDRSFNAAGPRVWNSLPPLLRRDVNFARFKRQLKTFLFGAL